MGCPFLLTSLFTADPSAVEGLADGYLRREHADWHAVVGRDCLRTPGARRRSAYEPDRELLWSLWDQAPDRGDGLVPVYAFADVMHRTRVIQSHGELVYHTDQVCLAIAALGFERVEGERYLCHVWTPENAAQGPIGELANELAAYLRELYGQPIVDKPKATRAGALPLEDRGDQWQERCELVREWRRLRKGDKRSAPKSKEAAADCLGQSRRSLERWEKRMLQEGSLEER